MDRNHLKFQVSCRSLAEIHIVWELETFQCLEIPKPW